MSTGATEYDVILAGGGTAGCLIAGRLAAADPSLKILVIEAGPHTRDLPAHTQPARYYSHLLPTSKTVTFNVGNPSKELNGRSPVVPSGRCVGGGSSINFAMYTRAVASDYDDWKSAHGNTGWGSKDLIPLLKKTETYQITPDQPTHGYKGPLKVSYGGIYTNVGKQFLEVAANYDKERDHTDDANCLFCFNKYGRWPKWIDADTGRRSDVPHHFIYNQERNKNLVVLGNCRVKRVMIQNNRAVGVEYVNDITNDPDADQTVHTAQASRLVVVSAGAFGSPTILERSGIGSKGVVEKAGIESVVDLPGVGESYQDHNLMGVPCFASKEAETLCPIVQNNEEEMKKYNALWIKEGKGLLANNGLDAGIKLRPSGNELQELGKDFATRWASYFANAPDKPIMWFGSSASYAPGPSPRKYFRVGYYTLYPVATGYVHIKSSDPHALADFNPQFLSDPADMAILKWGYKKAREIARRMPIYRGEFGPGNPKFSEDSDAYCMEMKGPFDIDAPNIKYNDKDDRAIEEYIRNSIQTMWHSLGTCAMKPRKDGGVVDERLNVYGMQGLKVADMSIAPSNVAANTYSTALVIGEKAAVIIAEELGIHGV